MEGCADMGAGKHKEKWLGPPGSSEGGGVLSQQSEPRESCDRYGVTATAQAPSGRALWLRRSMNGLLSPVPWATVGLGPLERSTSISYEEVRWKVLLYSAVFWEPFLLCVLSLLCLQ